MHKWKCTNLGNVHWTGSGSVAWLCKTTTNNKMHLQVVNSRSAAGGGEEAEALSYHESTELLMNKLPMIIGTDGIGGESR